MSRTPVYWMVFAGSLFAHSHSAVKSAHSPPHSDLVSPQYAEPLLTIIPVSILSISTVQPEILPKHKVKRPTTPRPVKFYRNGGAHVPARWCSTLLIEFQWDTVVVGNLANLV